MHACMHENESAKEKYNTRWFLEKITFIKYPIVRIFIMVEKVF